MEQVRSVVGIDISKDNFHVCLKQASDRVVIKGSRSFENNLSGFRSLLDWCKNKIKEDSKLLFIMEATGVYHENLTYFLYENEVSVAVVLANKIKHFAKSLNIKTKTDKADASMIADYGLERNPALWKPMTTGYIQLRQLCREYLSMKKDLVRCKNQQHALNHTHNADSFLIDFKEEHIRFLEQSIQTIESKINTLSQADKALNERIKKLESIPGLRRMTIIILLSETNGFNLFHGIRQLVSYAGLDVSERQSGKYKGKSSISKKGNTYIRQCLYMPAISACRYNKPINALYGRILEKNPTIKRKGIVAGMRKLLILVFVLWTKNESFQNDYQWAGSSTVR